MVVASIWFFFWAKNGGFVWRETDWEDYKSTVLRRKDKDGNTLSNATKSTKLGQRSIAGTFTEYGGDEKIEPTDYGYRAEKKREKKSRPHAKGREPSDEDVRAYRHEKPARVGGMNRPADGSHFDFSNTDRSDVASDIIGSDLSRQPLRPKPASPKKKSYMEKKREKKEEKKQAKEQKTSSSRPSQYEQPRKQERRPAAPHAQSPSIPDTSQYHRAPANPSDDSYYAAYRPQAPLRPYTAHHDSPRRQSPARRSNPPSAAHSRQSSPWKHAPKYPGSFDAYSDGGSSDTGTRTYAHYIPELSRGSKDTGYRRGAMGGRRDSLSDSDGDLGNGRY